MKFLALRQPGYDRLNGKGIEIGGFEHPAKVPHAEELIRCDRITTEEAARLFPELDACLLPRVDVVLDMDSEGLSLFPGESKDFIVCCHVLEHLKNPIRALSEILRVLVKGGLAAIAVPDKRFTFDRDRPLTEWKVLERVFCDDIRTPVPEDYLDIAKYIHPNLLALPRDILLQHLSVFMQRREHLYVWDSDSFLDFIVKACGLLNTEPRFSYISDGDRSQFEIFFLLEKI